MSKPPVTDTPTSTTLSEKPQFTVIVPAAGVGKRMQADRPKQYLPLLGKTLLECTLNQLIAHPQIKHIVVVIAEHDTYFAKLAIADAPWLTKVIGGAERADSVLAGLNAVKNEPWILVHDAARPCIAHSDISKLLALHTTHQGGILAMPVRDTMKRSSKATPNLVSHSETRDYLWHALTPQFFPTQALQRSLSAALSSNANITDEASAIEYQGGSVTLVEGLTSNLKVTHPEDLQLAAYYLQQLHEKQTHG